jgi:hypothetical protein
MPIEIQDQKWTKSTFVHEIHPNKCFCWIRYDFYFVTSTEYCFINIHAVLQTSIDSGLISNMWIAS